ncbi:WD40 repeat-like protein [Armillaria solidipes]|uniref:WD40 repeat-like protein n=1 Tax=Armillaria solidipes TaxID=1076256 RepID=A0A2H3CEF4_9AGAR|nr:WD40 repeat-like protein [Armillaria solidipes]
MSNFGEGFRQIDDGTSEAGMPVQDFNVEAKAGNVQGLPMDSQEKDYPKATIARFCHFLSPAITVAFVQTKDDLTGEVAMSVEDCCVEGRSRDSHHLPTGSDVNPMNRKRNSAKVDEIDAPKMTVFVLTDDDMMDASVEGIEGKAEDGKIRTENNISEALFNIHSSVMGQIFSGCWPRHATGHDNNSTTVLEQNLVKADPSKSTLWPQLGTDDVRPSEGGRQSLNNATREHFPPSEPFQLNPSTVHREDRCQSMPERIMPSLSIPSPNTRTTKEGLKLALTLAEKALDGLPIPGVKGTVGGVLKLIENAERVSANTETLQLLQEHVQNLLEHTLQPLAQITEKDIPEGLREDLNRFVGTLDELRRRWEASGDRGVLRRFTDAAQDEADLKLFAEDIQRAVTQFQFGAIIRGRRVLSELKVGFEEHEEKSVLRERTKLVNLLPRAELARYSSGRQRSHLTCFEGTRVEVLRKIKFWMEDPDDAKPRLFWLSGLAGIGKSTIATTIAEYAEKKGFLGGSFFFDRFDDKLSNPFLVFPTLAFHLAQFDHSVKSSIGRLLEDNPDYGSEPIQKQLSDLIIEPLRHSGLPPGRLVVLVLDALDECQHEDKAAEILQLLIVHLCRTQVTLRVLLTSRPEAHLRSVFQRQHNYSGFVLHDIEDTIVQGDIRRYLQATLVAIPRQLQVTVQPGWPGAEELEELVQKSGKLFVYAAIAVRFIGDHRVRKPERQLQILLGLRSSTKTRPYADLDKLYLQVLRNALPPESEEEDNEIFRWVVGNMVLMHDPMPLTAFSRFTRVPMGDIHTALYHLHSIILTPSENDPPRIYHLSFPDFITNPKRCTEPAYCINSPATHKRMALYSLQLLNKNLRRDIAGFNDLSLLNSEKEDLEEAIDQALPPEVKYSCRYWSDHLVNIECCDVDISQALELFVDKYMLYWFEAMSLLKEISRAISSMKDAHRWAVRANVSSHVRELLYDGYRFILSHHVNIGHGAMQVYRSALPFTPHNTLLYRTYQLEEAQSLHVLHGVSPHWSPCLSSVHDGRPKKKSVAYSHDGARFVIGYTDNVVAVWDAISGMLIVELFYQTPQAVLAVAFLPDDAHVVSASDIGDICVWDILSATPVRTLRGHSDAVNCISVCKNRPTALASASTDGTIRLWDTSLGTCTSILCPDRQPVFAVAFLPSGTSIVSGSNDGIIRLWDLIASDYTETKAIRAHDAAIRTISITSDGLTFATGSSDCTVKMFAMEADIPTFTFEGHSDAVCSIAFSPDGTALVSAASEDRYMRVWSTSTGCLTSELRGYVEQVDYTPDGKQMVSVSNDGTWRLWAADQLPSIIDPLDHKAAVCSVVFSSDGRLLATGGGKDDPLVKVWSTDVGEHMKTMCGHSSTVCSLAFSHDQRRLASGSGDRTVRIWDISSGESLSVLRYHDDRVKDVNFSHDDLTVISRTTDKTYTWDLQGGVDSFTAIAEHNEDDSGEMRGASQGYQFSMEEEHYVFMGKASEQVTRRVGGVLEEYRISGFAFHSDRVVFACIYGPVLILDISRLKSEFS